ncbi:MAG: hypothetical protein OEZ34_01190 [Spirochaetia bacterium]|nr:hypothetical protein [Spirochaetia bacterium]
MATEAEKETAKKIKEGIQTLSSDAEKQFNELRDKMMVYREGANEFFDSMAEYIKENPQKATIIGSSIGLGLGIILGLLMRGGRRD